MSLAVQREHRRLVYLGASLCCLDAAIRPYVRADNEVVPGNATDLSERDRRWGHMLSGDDMHTLCLCPLRKAVDGFMY